MSGGSSRMIASASSPDAAPTTSIARGAEHRVEQPHVLRQVVDDENDRVVAHGDTSLDGRKLRTCAGSACTLIGFSR